MRNRLGLVPTLKAFSVAAGLTARLAAVLAACLVFAGGIFSCSNMGGDVENPAAFTAVQPGGTGRASVPLKMGSVSGTIQQKEEQPAISRSVVPTVVDVTGGITSYTVSAWGTKADGTVVPESSPITVDTATTSFSMGLEYGTWTLRADAKDTSSNIIMTQTAAAPITLDDSSPIVNMNFALDYAQISGKPGAFSLTMAYDTSVKKISYTLSNSGGSVVASGDVDPAPASSFTLDSSIKPALGALAPGDYTLVVEFLAADSSVLMRMDQAVQIYSNITTNKIDGVAPYINAGAVNVSSDVIKKYQQSVVYVGGTGIGSGTAASDSNNGTQFDPVEHVERALEIINASMLTAADVPDGFKIFVQADTSLTESLALSSSKKISIVGTRTSAYYKIDGALTHGITASADDVSFSYINLNKIHGFDITGGQTTLKNCSITNGKARVDSTMIYASSGGGGGGICVKRSAKAILTDCSISGCSAESGGAVYVRDDSESGVAEVELTRCVLGDASRTSCASESDCSNKATGGGGGIYINKFGKATLTDTKIIGNVAVDGCGGAIYCNAGTLAINGGQINYNHSRQSGGGLYVGGWASAVGSVVLDGCVIGVTGASAPATGISDCGNYCETYGSGAGLYIDENATLSTTSGFSVLKNYCGSSGGGFYNKSATATVLPDCDISYNACADNGGGIYNEGTLSLQGGTIAGNAAASDGGGVYLTGGAKLFMSGGAIIGDKDADSHADENHYSNKAANGGAIAIDKGEAYIGYTSATAKDDDFEGGIYYNFASGGGGGVSMSDDSANKLYCYKGNIDKNCAPYFGGAICTGDAGEVQISKTTLSQNIVGWYGGAISIGNTNASTVTVALADATLEKNCITKYDDDGYGGAIYAQYYDAFAVSGATYIPAGDASGTTGPGRNDVWLKNGKAITIGSTLSATPTPVATITPETYAPGTAVLVDTGTGTSAGALVQSELSKFAVTPDSGEEWTIGYNDSTKKGVLSTATIYVDGTATSEGTGSKTSPCKTVANALTKVTAPNCTIIVKNGTTETEGLTTPAGCPGLTIKSADTTKKTIKGTSSINIHFEAAATASNVTFSNWGCVYVASSVATVEFENVAITDCSDCGLWLGGGAKVTAQNLTVKDCSVTDASGGGIFVNGGANLSVDGLVMQGCHADSEDCDGGGISNSGTVSLRQAKITGCTAGRHGAGIFNANNATLILDNDCDIPSGIYLTGGDDVSATAAKPLYIKGPYFALADGASKIPLEPEIRSGAGNDFQEGSAVIKGWEPESGSGAYTVKEEQVNCFATSGTALSLEYDGTATPPCGKLVDKSIAGGVTVNLGGSILFEIGTPSASGEKARFNVIDNSSGTPIYVTPTSAQIKILQYGTPVYSADAQEVTATYLAEGEYELYCKAVIGGVIYDTTLPFGAGGKYTPLTLEAMVANAKVTFTNRAADVVTYKKNGGALETIASGESAEITLDNIGDKVQFFGDNAKYASSPYNNSNILCDKECYVYGNVMSLVDSDGFASADTLMGDFAFALLFYNNSKIKNKAGYDLLLPATTLKNSCYQGMFQGCKSLTSAPTLPATALKDSCYYAMLQNCTSLETAPELPAETLESNCYAGMFYGCTSLTTAPDLPAKNLASGCYWSMFGNCTSLTVAPDLPATTLASSCYKNMFQDCTSLATAPALPATTLKNDCYMGMFQSCSSLTTAPALPATTLESYCYNSMFRYCSSLTTAPELPATTLAGYCYTLMFDECTSLTTAPLLPAPILVDTCYYGMFEECTNLNSVTCLATDISANDCTKGWLSSVSPTGTFTQAPGVAWPTGANGIPSGWTVVNAP